MLTNLQNYFIMNSAENLQKCKSRELLQIFASFLTLTRNEDNPAFYGRSVVSFYLPSIFLSFSSPNLSGHRLDVYHAYFYTWRGPSANLECRSEMCCTRLAANAGPKKVAKNGHLGTMPQLCRAISSQLRHVSTIGKKLVKQQYLPYMSS